MINSLSPRLKTQTTQHETRTTPLETRTTQLETRYSKISSFEDRGLSQVVRVSSDCQLTFDRYCTWESPPPPPPPPRVNGRHVAVALTLLSFWFKVFYISYMICFLSVLIQESWSKDDKLQWWFEAGYQAYNAWLEGCPGCIYGIYKWFYLHYNVAAQELSNHNAF